MIHGTQNVEKPTVFLLDSYELVRHGLRALLEPEYVVVGECDNGLSCIAAIVQSQPDVLIMEFRHPAVSGLEIIRQVHDRLPATHILVLSSRDDDLDIRRSLRSGALGFVLKDTSGNELLNAVRTVAAGQRYLSRVLQERAIQVYAQRMETDPDDPYDTLSSREREIFSLVVQGKTTAQIAEQLSISPRTVENHRASIMRKLCVHSQIELVRLAMRRGLVE